MPLAGLKKKSMANFPFANYTLPSADPPYPVSIRRHGEVVIKTDNCGISFTVIGDKYFAASGLLEAALNDVARIISPNSFKHRVGAFNFIVKDKRIVDCEEYFSKEIFGSTCSDLVEKRPEVFEMIEIIKSLLKLKVFL